MIDDIERALEEHILLIPNEPTIAWWGRPFIPVLGEAYLAATVTSSSAQPIGVGAKAPELWEGFLQLTVVQPTADGPRVASARARAVRDHFPRGLTLIRNNARVIIMARSIQPVMPAIDWLNTPVLINWICEEIPA